MLFFYLHNITTKENFESSLIVEKTSKTKIWLLKTIYKSNHLVSTLTEVAKKHETHVL